MLNVYKYRLAYYIANADLDIVIAVISVSDIHIGSHYSNNMLIDMGQPVAQYIKRKTKQIKKQTVLLNLLHGPRKVFYCVLFFQPTGLLAVTYNDT